VVVTATQLAAAVGRQLG